MSHDAGPPVKRPRVAPGRPTRHHVLALLREHLRALRAREAGTRLGRDPEELHGMRTAVRRLRAVLGAVRDMFDLVWVRGLRSELDWLGTALGARRDLDVLRQHLHTELTSLKSGKRTVARDLLARLDAQRARAHAGVVAALDSPRYARLLRRLEEAVQRPRVARQALTLPGVAAGEFKKLRKTVRALPDDPSDQDLHAVRIKLKRARYAAELAQPLAGRPAERFIKTAKKLQDILGEHQDAVVAEQRLRGLLGADRRPPAKVLSRALAQREGDRRETAKTEFLDGWPKLKRRGRKAWKRA
jgi:CHAD domain-containing protein